MKIMKNSLLCDDEAPAHSRLLHLNQINKFARIDGVIERGHMINLKIRWLDLSNDMNILVDFKRLENLELIDCKIGAIPERIVDLDFLKSLTISFFRTGKIYGKKIPNEQYFEVKDLFPTIYFVDNLEELTLENVLIDETMEIALGDLTNLCKLHLNHCGFSHFPESIYNLNKLKDLSLAGNDINEFPEFLLSLPIEKFFINNQIKGDFTDEY